MRAVQAESLALPESVVDYFRPMTGYTLCDMLSSYTKHDWSKDGITWVTPNHYGGHLGGSQGGWPRSNVAGDSRTYLSFWGGAGGASGCCHNTLSDGASWRRTFVSCTRCVRTNG